MTNVARKQNYSDEDYDDFSSENVLPVLTSPKHSKQEDIHIKALENEQISSTNDTTQNNNSVIIII